MLRDHEAELKESGVDEFDLLKKYRAENPKYLAFQDINDRSLSLEERFTEFELEKLVKKIEETLNARKAAYTKPGEAPNVVLPILAHLKSTQVLMMRVDGV